MEARPTTTHQWLGILLGQTQPHPMLESKLKNGLLGHFQDCGRLAALVKVMGQAQSPGKAVENCLLRLRDPDLFSMSPIMQWDPGG